MLVNFGSSDPGDDLGRRNPGCVAHRAVNAHLDRSLVPELFHLAGKVISVQDQVYMVLLDPGTIDREWCVGYYFINVATALYRSHALLHGKYRAALVTHHRFIGVNTHQEVVTVFSGQSEEIHVTVMEQIGHHIDVHARDIKFSWLRLMRY